MSKTAKSKASRVRRAVVGAGVALATVGAGLGIARIASASQRYQVTMDAVALRSGPGTQYAVVGRLNKGAAIDIECQVQGGTNVGGNATWDRLTNGQWITDYYTTTPSFNSYAPGLGKCGAAAPAPTPAPTPPPSGGSTARNPVTVSGVVVCASGQPVEGVWVDASAGGSGWAGWRVMPGAAHVAQYSRVVTSNGNMSLHVGCGGSPSSWRSDNRTPAIGIGGGRTVNTVCNDAPGTATRCTFPATGLTRTYNPGYAGNCTWGAAYKMYQAIGRYPGWNGDARLWAANAQAAGWTVRPEPMPRSIFVFQPGGGTTSPYGHVGWVDSVEYRADGTYLHTTEMNARGLNVWSSEVRKHQGSMRFILVP